MHIVLKHNMIFFDMQIKCRKHIPQASKVKSKACIQSLTGDNIDSEKKKRRY